VRVPELVRRNDPPNRPVGDSRASTCAEKFYRRIRAKKASSHDAIDIIGKGPAHAHEVKVEHPFWLSAPASRISSRVKSPPRQRRGVDVLSHNIGIGCNSPPSAPAVFNEAKAKGVGREIPTDWFLETCIRNLVPDDSVECICRAFPVDLQNHGRVEFYHSQYPNCSNALDCRGVFFS